MTDCRDCGACCLHMATPPYIPEEADRLPANVRSDYEAAIAFREMQWAVVGTDAIPCAFFDALTRTCRHHEHRPQVCRDFEVGGVYCNGMRDDAGLVQIQLER